MSENKRTVERYMEAYNRLDHEEILDCLTNDVEWLLPGAFTPMTKMRSTDRSKAIATPANR